MDRSTQSYRSRADEYLPKSTEPRMSSGSETEKGNPTTTATEGGSDATNEEYRLVYVRKLSAPNDPEALRLARDVLKEADNNDELCVQASGDCRAVANPEGFQYAGYNSLNNETKTFREGNAQSEAAWNCYVAIRCRFMASYERKCKGEGGITRNEVGMIETGNQKAHGGDCQMDSLVVKSQAGARMDTYTSLYGMAPDEVERITHDWIIDELNTHATAVAHTRKRTTDAYSDAFDKFIAALKEEGITTASDLNPSVRTAYDALKTAQVYEPKARNKSGKNGNPAKG